MLLFITLVSLLPRISDLTVIEFCSTKMQHIFE